MNRKSSTICGKNVITLPTPPITPSQSKLCRAPGGMWAAMPERTNFWPASIQSMNGRAPV